MEVGGLTNITQFDLENRYLSEGGIESLCIHGVEEVSRVRETSRTEAVDGRVVYCTLRGILGRKRHAACPPYSLVSWWAGLSEQLIDPNYKGVSRTMETVGFFLTRNNVRGFRPTFYTPMKRGGEPSIPRTNIDERV